jgi:3-phenylpropionate/trans-cinnamate dioxygenase ferredoxin reductase component
MHINQWDEGITPVEDLIHEGKPVDRDRLADPAVPLADTTKS